MNIEDVQVGDLVYSYNTATGEVGLREVTDTFVRESDHINYLTIVDENGNEQTIETTDGHPFWVVTNDPDLSRAARDYVFENGVWLYHEDVTPTEFGYWVEAKDLRVGDVFLGANGELSALINIVRVEQEGGIAVYNFSVDENHDYFVIAKGDYGQTCILVHNAWYKEDFKDKNFYKSFRESPTCPEDFVPRTPPNMSTTTRPAKNGDVLAMLKEKESGKWNKVFKDGYSNGREVSVHYFQHDKKPLVWGVKVKDGWSNY